MFKPRDEIPFPILIKVSTTWWFDVFVGYGLVHGLSTTVMAHVLLVDIAEILHHLLR